MHQLTLPTKEGRGPGRHFLSMRLVDTLGEGWQTFDVTSTVRDWIRYPSEHHLLHSIEAY